MKRLKEVENPKNTKLKMAELENGIREVCFPKIALEIKFSYTTSLS